MSDRKEPTPCPEHAIKPDPPPAPPKPYVRGAEQLGVGYIAYAAGIQAERARILAVIDEQLKHEWRETVDRLKEAIRAEA